MQAILQGSTAQFSPDQILRFLALHGHSGTLEITSAKEKALVSFEGGRAVYAQTAGAARGASAILEVFAWDPGVFTFYDGVYVPDHEQRSVIDLETALEQGLRRAADYRTFRAAFPSDHIIVRLSDDASPTEGVHLEPVELRMLLKIGPGRSIGQLSSDFRQPAFELYPMLKRLEGLGLVVRGAAATPPVDPAGITIRPGDVVTEVRRDEAPPVAPDDGTQRIAALQPQPGNADAATERIAVHVPPAAEEKEAVEAPAATAPPEAPVAGVPPEVPAAAAPPELPSAASPIDAPEPPQVVIPHESPVVAAEPLRQETVPPPSPQETPASSAAPVDSMAPPSPEPVRPAETPGPSGPFTGENPVVAGPMLGTLTMTGGTMFPLIDEVYGIGRDPANSIPIAEQSVSSFHAKIIRGERGFFIEDTRSRNGTFVNGERVEMPRLLADADVIRVGKVVMTFTLAKPAARGSTTAPPRM